MRFEDGETLLGRAFSDCVHSTVALERDIAPLNLMLTSLSTSDALVPCNFWRHFPPAFSSAEKSPGNEVAVIMSRTNDRDNDNNHNGNNGDDLDDDNDNVNDKDDNDSSKNSNDNDNDDNEDDTDNVQDNNNVKNK